MVVVSKRESDYMPMNTSNAEILTAAIEGFESQKRRIDEQIAQLKQMLDGKQPQTAGAPAAAGRKRRKMSAAARARISEAQRKRWAATKQPATHAAAPKKRKLSAAGRKRIIAATKARWARVRAEREKPAAKRTGKAATA
jgi:hypothetical protein